MCEQAGGPEEIAACILQDRSPSCGAGRIYDGTFSGTLTAGNGVFVDLLLRHGYRVIPASEFDSSMLRQSKTATKVLSPLWRFWSVRPG